MKNEHRPMRVCNLDFPGTDRATSASFARDVASDEKAMIDAISDLRHRESSSLEAIGYLMGADPAQLSRYLKGTRSISLANYIRIARALGYRSRLVLEKADAGEASSNVLHDLKIVPHKVRRIQQRKDK
jgi:transcriptional regulator with XRE-family HTH domain